MSKPIGVLLIVALVGGLILANTIFFTVREYQQALVLQFGAPQGDAINAGEADEAGLKFKLPWQNVVYFDKRNLEFDLQNAEEIIVANEERLLVDAFVRYKIVNPLLYYQTFGAGGLSEQDMRVQVNTRMTNVLNEALRQAFGAARLREIITTRRAQLVQDIQTAVTDEAQKFGVFIVDVRIHQADFPRENAEQVYNRMISDYEQQAERIRADGQRRAREIRAQADKERVQIVSRAEEEAQVIQGRADATRNCIFAGAYEGLSVDVREVEQVIEEVPVEVTTDATDGSEVLDERLDLGLGNLPERAAIPDRVVSCDYVNGGGQGDRQRAEFFAFYRSLEAYKTSLQDGQTTILLSPDSEFFQYFNGQGIPQ